MTKFFCDICGRQVRYYSRRRLNGAIRAITGAEAICIDCERKIKQTDWNAVVRREIKEATP